MVVQMLLAERTHICSVCVANDHCELQALANQLGVDHVIFERNWSNDQLDLTHDFLVIDRNRCILCTRCIRVCDQIEGVHTLDLKLRGKKVEEMPTEDINHFFESLATALQANVHIFVEYGSNDHHKAEAATKALALSMRQAIAVDPRRKGVPSSKGVI